MLRQYLEYAAASGARMGDGAAAPTALDHFELDDRDALTAKGLSLIPQWGASRYRIDLVVQHPAKPGRFVMAIECDGASYHSAPTARDRDRLRPQHLEALGWRFHRIWSTDWFMRREEEIDRVLAAFESAVAQADRLDAGDAITGGSDLPAAAPPMPSAGARSTRPAVPRRSKIEEYSQRQVARLVRWIQSDGRLRTDEEIVDEMVAELGFIRRGKNIEAEIRRAIERVRRESQAS
jgi:very-short-patch-repair endonuclease